MKNIVLKFFALLLLAVSFAACKKDYGNKLGPLQDSLAAIPITVTNQVYFERFPVVTAKVDTTQGPTNSTGTFSIALSIPADKGKIKEITKIAMGNSGVSYLQNSSAPNYPGAPIAGNGSNTITFSSDLPTVRAYSRQLAASAVKGTAYVFTGQTKRLSQTLTPNPTPQTPNQLRFFFLVTLEDGTQLISTEVDVRLI
ncbi:hypothetical protein GKZ68_18830 [Hymenobacter sp. BRD128]|uniref:hypothetical protein n=1 Tax=Hymenobacter sp. BRD128 TaxID=2675878 RepID=UPI0015660C43|nr:hypothetical protein [Hymenobacter sp. BRD128]QKG58504.1 hypothetical protein GKZ68_18830 [Hymenobacter sp. BRD128]